MIATSVLIAGVLAVSAPGPDYAAARAAAIKTCDAIEIVPSRVAPVLVHADGYYVDPRSDLRIFVRQQDIAARFPAFVAGATYRVRVVVTFTLPANGGSRFMSEAFLERVFPLRERTQSIEHDVRF